MIKKKVNMMNGGQQWNMNMIKYLRTKIGI